MYLDQKTEELEWKYAELALKPGWLEYIRNEVKFKQRLEIFKGMGIRESTTGHKTVIKR